MASHTVGCPRCAAPNHPSERYCAACGLPLGVPQPDAGAAMDALGAYEEPEPQDSDAARGVRTLLARCGFEASPFGHGWRLLVPLHLDRRQAVYVGPAGTDPEGRALVSLVSVCGPANDRDARTLLKLNARPIEGHFAIRMLRGEEYFVFAHALPADAIDGQRAGDLVRRIAREADGLEERLSRGRDIY